MVAVDRVRFVVMAWLILSTALPAMAGGWEKINEEAGIEVFSREFPDSDLKAFKGTAVVELPLARILAVLATNARRTEWVDRLYVSTVLERHSPFDYIVYQAFGLPAIFSDRDYVYRGTAVRDARTGVVDLHLRSVEHPKAPETVGVRANLINSRYTLIPLARNKTGVAVEIHTDPRGWLPSWIVNMIQKSWPLKTLGGLRTQSHKSDISRYPLPPVAADALAQ